MAIIGPRPLLVRYLARYNEEQHHRHDVRPGLTGYAQAHGRNAVSWEDKFAMDVWYTTHITFVGDATSFDSIAYTAACYSYKKLEENEHPHKLVSLLWCILLIVLPIALVFSESSMNNIQSISIISAFPIGIIMIIMIWGFIKDIKIYMKKELKGKEWQNN